MIILKRRKDDETMLQNLLQRIEIRTYNIGNTYYFPIAISFTRSFRIFHYRIYILRFCFEISILRKG